MVLNLVIPEGTPRYNDMVDVVVQAATKYEDVQQKDGTIIKEQIIDNELLWWGMGKVDSEKFGALAFELKEFERMAIEAFNNMTSARAKQYYDQIMEIGKSIRISIEAKSSESRRDKHNAKQTKLDTIGRNRVEKVYSIKDDMKRAGLGSIFGGNKARDEIADD